MPFQYQYPRAALTVDLRNPDDAAMQRAEGELDRFLAGLEAQWPGLSASTRRMTRTRHVPFDQGVQDAIAAAPQITEQFKIINSHPALLPAFPGAHAVRDALAAGVSETGTTIHWVDAGVDTGEVIAQEKVAVLPSDSEETLHERIKIIERGLIVATIRQLLTSLETSS